MFAPYILDFIIDSDLNPRTLIRTPIDLQIACKENPNLQYATLILESPDYENNLFLDPVGDIEVADDDLEFMYFIHEHTASTLFGFDMLSSAANFGFLVGEHLKNPAHRDIFNDALWNEIENAS